ncbi:hypothetical protein [Kitasatospora sp. MBT63]|uniref:hypothetical protein n=1 Tax=Kitasatospora sp. MBT63 TaxID=1444768 RepID=UPI00053B4E2A|nr:hypothetical protein [Kitasatospora sp. MBT63]
MKPTTTAVAVLLLGAELVLPATAHAADRARPSGSSSLSGSILDSPSDGTGQVFLDPSVASGGQKISIDGTCPQDTTAVTAITSGAFEDGAAAFEDADPQAFTATARIQNSAEPKSYPVEVSCTTDSGTVTILATVQVQGAGTGTGTGTSPAGPASLSFPTPEPTTAAPVHHQVPVVPKGAPDTGEISPTPPSRDNGLLVLILGLSTGTAAAALLGIRRRRTGRR